MSDKQEAKLDKPAEDPICFVIMPISDPDSYVKGHFSRVYEDIIKPACRQAGFSPIRADEVKQTNLIHLDILQKLIEAPMAVCDLSTRNPNVLFELALRQAFDKPVTLIQEIGTPQIFDISPFRFTEYRKERIYHEVLEDQKNIAEAIKETYNAHGTGRSINSIVKLLALSKPAVLPEIGSPEAKEDLQQLILAELSQLRDEIRSVRRDTRIITAPRAPSLDISLEIETIRNLIMGIETLLVEADESTLETAPMMLKECQNRLKRLMYVVNNESITIKDQEMLKMLMALQQKIKHLHIMLHQRWEVPTERKSNANNSI